MLNGVITLGCIHSMNKSTRKNRHIIRCFRYEPESEFMTPFLDSDSVGNIYSSVSR